MELDFSGFQPQTKADWAVAATKALKGKPLSTLQWKVDEEITLDPIYTADEVEDDQQVIAIQKDDNDWWIGEEFNGEEATSANDLLLKALYGGLNSPCILDVNDYDVCLKDVRVDYLFPIFKDAGFDEYIEWLEKHHFDKDSLQGAFIVCNTVDETKTSEGLEAIRRVSESLPNYYYSSLWITLDGEHISSTIADGLTALSEMIFQFKQADIPVKIVCEIECTNNFIQNVASIRALRLLIAQMCDAYEITQHSLLLDAHIFESASDTQLSMIGASAKATAAVTGGVDRLTIQCEGLQKQEEEDVTRRMTRNIHHMMKMESGLHQVQDPAAGSYTIEKLTKEIATLAWQRFQKAKK